jgi:hypothetical protein
MLSILDMPRELKMKGGSHNNFKNPIKFFRFLKEIIIKCPHLEDLTNLLHFFVT